MLFKAALYIVAIIVPDPRFLLFVLQSIVSYKCYIRPFLTRKFFQEILGLEGSKIYWKKNVSYEKFPRPKFPQEKKARILPAEEIFEPKISWRQGNFTRKFLDHLIIELKSVQDEYWMMPTAVRTHNCVLCYTHTCIESHKRCLKSLVERAWQDCCTRWSDD